MATSAELTARLAKINTAIDAVLEGGQSYELNGRKFTRADLGELRRMRREIENELSQSQGTGRRNVARFRLR